MIFEIKHKIKGNIIFSLGCASLKICVEAAVKSNADLCHADLRDANLRGADLRDADLRGADLCHANLRGADLRDADLRGADLRDADFRGADLRGTDFRDADFRGANLRGTDFRGADLWISHFRSFIVVATTHHLQIGCENHPWDVWLDDAKRAEIAIKNNDNGDFEGFWQICLAAKTWLDSRFKKAV